MELPWCIFGRFDELAGFFERRLSECDFMGGSVMNMKKARLVLALVALLASACAAAQAQAPEVGLIFHPGDRITVEVSLKMPFATDGGRFYFQLQGPVPVGQEGFASWFQSNDFRKISDNTFEFSSVTSDTLASGTYQLSFVEIIGHGVSKRYSAGTDFKDAISIKVINSKRVDFPEIKELTVRP
jgi:hypothetical protein